MKCSVCGREDKKTYRRHKFGSVVLCAKHNAQMEKNGRILERTYKDANKINIYEGYIGVILTDKHQNFKGEALISNDKVHLLGRRKWYISYGYAKSGWGHASFLHHVIFGSPPNGLFVDHINGNRLDNRNENIRFVSRAQNAMNSKVPNNNPFGAKGVSFDKRRKKYRAYIKINQRQIFLGHFKDINSAVEARKTKEQELFGVYNKNWQLAEVGVE